MSRPRPTSSGCVASLGLGARRGCRRAATSWRCVVRHLDADRLTAGDRGEDAHVGRRHRVGDVLVEARDPGDLHAGAELELVAGDGRADGHADEAGLDAVLRPAPARARGPASSTGAGRPPGCRLRSSSLSGGSFHGRRSAPGRGRWRAARPARRRRRHDDESRLRDRRGRARSSASCVIGLSPSSVVGPPSRRLSSDASTGSGRRSGAVPSACRSRRAAPKGRRAAPCRGAMRARRGRRRPRRATTAAPPIVVRVSTSEAGERRPPSSTRVGARRRQQRRSQRLADDRADDAGRIAQQHGRRVQARRRVVPGATGRARRAPRGHRRPRSSGDRWSSSAPWRRADGSGHAARDEQERHEHPGGSDQDADRHRRTLAPTGPAASTSMPMAATRPRAMASSPATSARAPAGRAERRPGPGPSARGRADDRRAPVRPGCPTRRTGPLLLDGGLLAPTADVNCGEWQSQ